MSPKGLFETFHIIKYIATEVEKMIEVNELVKKYGKKTVLNKISFKVEEGEILGLLGQNGAGKSTIMNIITGNISATDGSVFINGKEILESPLQAKKELGYLPELPPLYQDMTVKEYLNYVYQLKKCKLPKKEHIEKVCSSAHISDVYNRVIKNLSKGYKQRIGIAEALIGDPKVLIFDEPTVGLDPNQMIEIRKLIKDLGRKHTVIISSHILSEIQSICDRVIVINNGVVVANDTPSDLAKKLEGNCLRIIVEGPEKEVENALGNLIGVKSVQKVNCKKRGCCEFEIRGQDDVDIRRTISQYLKKSPWLLMEMTGVDMSLENIFLRLTGRK